MKRVSLLLLATFVLICCSSCTRTSSVAPAKVDETSPESESTSPEDPTSETNVSGDTKQHEDQVLRHAVFFSFKEDSSPEDVQSVVDAFRVLPGKIASITDFQSGTNNSPEKLDDGFTHCFFLTFKDKAALEEYIPHPAHSGDFADVLRPHMKSVFVFDYWGEPHASLDKELKHAVFFKFKDESSVEDVQKVVDAFAALPSKISSIKQFEWGLNNSPEGKDDGFTHCFMVTFDSEEGREEYLPHADHMAFVEILKPHLDKVRVLDFWGERVQ